MPIEAAAIALAVPVCGASRAGEALRSESPSRVATVIEYVQDDQPQIIATPIVAGASAYLDWIDDSVE